MPEAGDYNVIEIDGVTVLTVQVESLMGMNDVNRLQGEIDSVLASGATKLVLDVGKVRFTGSAALGVLMSVRKLMEERGGRFALAATQHLDPLLKVTRARSIFNIAPDADAAVKMLNTPIA